MTRIPFTHKMIEQLLAGHKVQTRRMRPRQLEPGSWFVATHSFPRPVGVKLALSHYAEIQAEIKELRKGERWQREGWAKRQAQFMPAWLCTIACQVQRVQIERICDISEADSRAEGFAGRDEFLAYFRMLHPGLDVEEKVQVIAFHVHTMNGLPCAELNRLKLPTIDITLVESQNVLPAWLYWVVRQKAKE